jgi:hypothetical protein
MRKSTILILVPVVLSSFLFAAETKDPPVGYDDTPFLPDGWRVHDIDRPQPTVVTPGKKAGDAPSDAIVLLDGTNLDAWKGQVINDKKRKKFNLKGEALWKVENGYVECTRTGDLFSRQEFGSCQLHVEFATENPPNGKSQGRSNSGVFLMGQYEIQVLDNYQNRTYADGGAGSVYGQTPPMVNVSRKPGEWQSYDIIFEAPKFKGDKLVKPAYITVLHNGVVVQHRTEVQGPTSHKKLAVYKPHAEKLSLKLQDHNNKTRFRNIWIRELEF